MARAKAAAAIRRRRRTERHRLAVAVDIFLAGVVEGSYSLEPAIRSPE
jgi:hypothetical protein